MNKFYKNTTKECTKGTYRVKCKRQNKYIFVHNSLLSKLRQIHKSHKYKTLLMGSKCIEI